MLIVLDFLPESGVNLVPVEFNILSLRQLQHALLFYS